VIPQWLKGALSTLAMDGLDLYGVTHPGPWPKVLPGARSVVVIASGGGRLFERVSREVRRGTAYETDPLDQFVYAAVMKADPQPGPTRKWIFSDRRPAVDFRTLARHAGLGHASRLGLLIHPKDGPWIGLRAACFTLEDLPQTPPLPDPSPCEGCSAPCAPACPAAALQSTHLDLNRCVRWRNTHSSCSAACFARAACVVGKTSAYSVIQQRYHNAWEDRPSLAQLLASRADEAR